MTTVLRGHFDTARAMEFVKMRSARDGRPVKKILRNWASSISIGRSVVLRDSRPPWRFSRVTAPASLPEWRRRSTVDRSPD